MSVNPEYVDESNAALPPFNQSSAASIPVDETALDSKQAGETTIVENQDGASSEGDFTPQLRSPTNGDLHLDIDIIDRCNLQCPTCWRGVGAQANTSVLMPVSLFREIVSKAHAEGYPNMALINWTEPFLCKTLHEYIPAVRESGMDCWLSSNLSLSPKDYLPTIVSALAAGVDILFVSVSGFTQSVYEINHKRGRVDWIKTNLEGIARELRAGKVKTSVSVRYLEFPYNSHETELWSDFAKSLGIGFDLVPAHGDPNNPLPSEEIFTQHVEDRRKQAEALNTGRTADDLSLEEKKIPEKVCSLITDRIAIDAKGDVYLCCAYPNSENLRIGAYTKLSEGELLLRRHNHSFCVACEIPSRRDTTDQDRDRFRKAWAERTGS